MSEKNTNEPAVRGEEPELNDGALEQVAGGCQVGQTLDDGGIKLPSPWVD